MLIFRLRLPHPGSTLEPTLEPLSFGINLVPFLQQLKLLEKYLSRMRTYSFRHSGEEESDRPLASGGPQLGQREAEPETGRCGESKRDVLTPGCWDWRRIVSGRELAALRRSGSFTDEEKCATPF